VVSSSPFIVLKSYINRLDGINLVNKNVCKDCLFQWDCESSNECILDYVNNKKILKDKKKRKKYTKERQLKEE
jgi:hypothetical protein